MANKVAAALFRDRDHAERAIHELREAGVPQEAISVVELHDDEKNRKHSGDHDKEHHRDDRHTTRADTGDNKATGALKGLAAGGTIGAIAGIGALLIPGIGPFIAGGALAQAIGAAGSAAVASGALGAAAGGLTGALVDYGLKREHAEYYEKRVREGAVFVAVDTSDDPSAYAPTRGILRAAGGETADSDETATTSSS